MAVIALDIGGTKIKAAVVTKQHKILQSIKVPTRKHKGRLYVLKTITILIENLLSKNKKITAIGISAPGIISEQGKFVEAGNVWFFKGLNLKTRLEKKFQLPVIVANDADCFTLAESIIGSYANANKILGIIWGSGIGAGLAFRQTTRNQWNVQSFPLEFGQSFVYNPLKKKNQRLDTIAGGLGITKSYKQLQGTITSPLVSDIYASKEKIARQVMNNALAVLGKAIGNLVNIFQPDVIVLGGGVSQLPKPVYVKLQKIIKSNSLHSINKKVQLKRYSISDDAGVLGAAILAHKLNT